MCAGVVRLSAAEVQPPASPTSVDEELLLPNWPAMAVPVINYTPETGWEFGGAAQAYIKLFSPRTSVIQIGGAYSLNRQWYVNAQGTLYFGTVLPWLLQFRAGFRNYPDTYYGTGAEPNKSGTYARKGTPYDSQRGYAFVQPLVHVGRSWYIGPHAEYLWERTRMQGDDESVTIQMPGIGVTAQFDSRATSRMFQRPSTPMRHAKRGFDSATTLSRAAKL